MATSKSFTRENKEIFYSEWTVENPVAIIGIVHGMSEHIDRYVDFIQILNKNNIIVYGMDARGHGKTAQNGILGHFEKNDWNNILEDINCLLEIEKEKYPNLPFFILGHSMGSFLTRHFLNKYNPDISGAIVMGTGTPDNNVLYRFTKIIADFKKSTDKAVFLHRTAFRPYVKKIQNPKTSFDWLSSDDNEIKKYIKDPMCGYCMTNGFYSEFMYGMLELSKLEKKINLDKNLRLFFVSGKDDPVGNYSDFVIEAYNKYKNAGIKDVDIKLYENMRHEILNEKNKSEVYQDILQFILDK